MGALDGKIAIITGAGSGIGRASALRFAAEGAKLVIGDKTAAVHDTAKAVKDAGGEVDALEIDAGVEADVASMVAAAKENFGGLKGSPVIGAYGVSKAADMQVARNFAVEFGPSGVRVNCIAPGLIRTDMARALWEDPATLKRATSTACLRRIGEPHEIAGAAVFLASRAGAFTTGQTIVCDGGATISGGA